ncbi:hypothetical protein FRC02_011464 [Tulasnella sp. 418]|nr:hypothetical protein FRC02_011464 [Tulasnella sp. 418]
MSSGDQSLAQRRFRGRRRASFVPIDMAEMVELRARTRTDASYARTSLGTLSYSIIILKLFDRRFYRSK